eukprot:15365041-Ditylum_brightwellii.AAC.1
MALDAKQVAAITAAAINTAGLGTTAETFLENPFADDINMGTKNGLALLNAATPAVLKDKCIDLSIKNFQKILDLLEDLNIRYQWIKLTKSMQDEPTGGPNAPVIRGLLKQFE